MTGIAVTDDFVRELRKLKLRVCPAAIVDKPKRNDDRKEARRLYAQRRVVLRIWA